MNWEVGDLAQLVRDNHECDTNLPDGEGISLGQTFEVLGIELAELECDCGYSRFTLHLKWGLGDHWIEADSCIRISPKKQLITITEEAHA